MPLFYEDKPNPNIEDKTQPEAKSGKVKYPNVILVLALFFFSLSCGIESIFQSQSFTFALCGPHNLSPKQACVFFTNAIAIVGLFFASHVKNNPHPQAASLTTTLCVSFLSGRFSGIFLSTRFTPKVMVVATNLGFATMFFLILSPCPPSCLVSSLLLASTAGWVLESLYIGTAIMGFSISMQVASGFAWLADQVGVSGSLC